MIFVWEWSLFGTVTLLFWNCGAQIRWILCCDFWPQSISFDVQTGMQLYLILTVFQLKTLCSAWPFGNSLPRIFRKDCPRLVATFLLKGTKKYLYGVSFFQSPLQDQHVIQNEIDNLLNIGVIKETTHCEGEFISTISIRPKKDGTYRLILNFKKS